MTCRKCGREVGEVRVGDMVLYGHKQQPHPSHPVRLARSVDVLGAPRLSEGPNVGREDGSSDDPSHLIATGTRPARKGSTRSRSAPSGISRQSGQGVASLIPPAIRPAPTAGD